MERLEFLDRLNFCSLFRAFLWFLNNISVNHKPHTLLLQSYNYCHLLLTYVDADKFFVFLYASGTTTANAPASKDRGIEIGLAYGLLLCWMTLLVLILNSSDCGRRGLEIIPVGHYESYKMSIDNKRRIKIEFAEKSDNPYWANRRMAWPPLFFRYSNIFSDLFLAFFKRSVFGYEHKTPFWIGIRSAKWNGAWYGLIPQSQTVML